MIGFLSSFFFFLPLRLPLPFSFQNKFLFRWTSDVLGPGAAQCHLPGYRGNMLALFSLEAGEDPCPLQPLELCPHGSVQRL